MTLVIAPIVEGHMEQGCIERLLQRIWQELLLSPERLQVTKPIRGNRDSLIHTNGAALTGKVEEAWITIRGATRKDPQAREFLLLLLDAESDCPMELAPRLLETARRARSDADIGCVLAKRMLENWIVAGAATLGGVQNLPAELQPPDNPEDRSGAKWLNDQIRSKNRARKYDKAIDARKFVAQNGPAPVSGEVTVVSETAQGTSKPDCRPAPDRQRNNPRKAKNPRRREEYQER